MEEELSKKIELKVQEYAERLGLAGWKIAWVINDVPFPNAAGELSAFAAASVRPFYDKRAARMSFRLSELTRDDGKYIPYLVAHELGHVFHQPLSCLWEKAMDSDYISHAYNHIHSDLFDEAEELLAHQMGVALSGVEPTVDFWMSTAEESKSCLHRKN